MLISKKLFFGILAGLFVLTCAFVNPENQATGTAPAVLNCPSPTVWVTSQESGTATFNLESGSGTLEYKYTNKTTNTHSDTYVAGNGNLTVSVAIPGTYIFYFRTVCTDGTSAWFPIDDLILL